MTSWWPHPNLDPTLIPATQKIIDGIPPAHLLPPSDGEVYEVASDCFERLQNHAFRMPRYLQTMTMTMRSLVVKTCIEIDLLRAPRNCRHCQISS